MEINNKSTTEALFDVYKETAHLPVDGRPRTRCRLDGPAEFCLTRHANNETNKQTNKLLVL
jgi:hypothetical protein